MEAVRALSSAAFLSATVVVAGCKIAAEVAYSEGERREREYQRRIFADLPPEQPARDLRAIAGKWEGAILLRDGTYPATMTIKDDGSYEILAPALFRPGPRFVGSMKVIDGKYRYESQTIRSTGTYRLHEGNGTRVLLGVSDRNIGASRFRPAPSQ